MVTMLACLVFVHHSLPLCSLQQDNELFLFIIDSLEWSEVVVLRYSLRSAYSAGEIVADSLFVITYP